MASFACCDLQEVSLFLRIYRDATGSHYGKKRGSDEHDSFDVASLFNDDDIIYQHGFMCPRTMLSMSRLLLFLRIIVKSPPALLNIVLAQDNRKICKGWVSSLKDDLHWLSSSDAYRPGAYWDLLGWVAHFKLCPSRHMKLIKSFCKPPFANICTQWATSKVLAEYASPMTCYICGKVSMSFQAHSVHLASSHLIKSKMRKYVDGRTCRICLKNFWTRERCLNHVRYRSKVCYANALMRGPVLSQEEADELDSIECPGNQVLYAAGRRRHKAVLPCIQMPGPLLPVIPLRNSSHHPLGFGHNYH